MSLLPEFERQLAAAAAGAAKRGRRRRALAVAGGVLGSVVVGGGALAATGVWDPRLGHDDPHGRAVERGAVALINRSRAQVNKAHPECQAGHPRPGDTAVHGPPPRELLKTFAVLRRPATPADRAASARRFPLGGEVWVDYVRRARAADGTLYTLVPWRRRPPKAIPHACIGMWHDRLVELSRSEPKEVRRKALAVEAQVQRSEHPDRVARQPVGVSQFAATGGGGYTTLSFLRRYGQFGTSGRPGGGAHVAGLVPDGVGSVTAIYPRAVSRGRYRDPKVYPTAIKVTAKANDNVVHFQVARSAADALPRKMVWRAADGRVLRTVHPPG